MNLLQYVIKSYIYPFKRVQVMSDCITTYTRKAPVVKTPARNKKLPYTLVESVKNKIIK